MTRLRLIDVHRWAGLALGLHWLLLAATGCVLVFHREIEAGVLAPRITVEGSPQVERAIAAVRAAGGSNVTRVMIQGEPVRAFRIFATLDGQAQIVLVGAVDAALLDSTPTGGGSSQSGIIRGIYKFHQQLLLGDSGEILVGTSGLFLLISVAIGVKIAWPARRQWRAAMFPRLAGKPWQKLFLLHRSTGLLVALPLCLSATTGAAIVWSDTLRGALIASGVASELSTSFDGEGEIVIAPDTAIRSAMTAMPHARFSRIDLPTAGRPAYTVHLRQPGELRAILGTSMIAIDGRTGAILSSRNATQLPWGDRVLDSLFALHNGEWLGVAGRLILFSSGLALLFLAVSGLCVWWKRRARRSVVRPAAQSAVSTGSRL